MAGGLLSSALIFLLLTTHGLARHHQIHELPPLREQAKIQDGWLEERLGNIPGILQKHGAGAWLISQKEYAEDTTFWSMKKAVQFSARRRTLSIFFADTENDSCQSRTWVENKPVLWNELRVVLEKCNPSSIAINVDSEIAFSGGLHAGEYQEITRQLGSPWKDRLVAVPQIAVEFVATMPASRLNWYRKLQETAWAVISEGFSHTAITPGTTTTEDLEWWFREKLQA